jgi:hypothetical protein
MKHRKLRIAFSAVCGVLCLLLIALWVRSYKYHEEVYWKTEYWNGFGVWSGAGRIVLTVHPSDTPSTHDRLVYLGAFSASNRQSVLERIDRVLPTIWGFGAGRRSDNQLIQAMVPDWFSVLVFAILAALPWARQLNWRFSLRTLLITTTLVAILLGLIVYAAR